MSPVDIWNDVLVYPLLTLLIIAYDFVHDFGFAVVIVTVLIRLALYPLYVRQIRSSRGLQELAPALNDIKKKYGSDRAKLNEEQMKLYRERGVNPAGGCLPMLVFLPVLIAMYSAFQQAPKFDGAALQEIVHRYLPFIQVGIPLDSKIDMTAHWLPWIQAAGRDLSQSDPYFILPVLSGALQLVASVMAMPRNPPKTDDPTQRTMQSMTYTFPLLTIVFFNSFPAGVFIYYITTTLFQIVQQYFVMGWGQLPRWLPFLAGVPTPADHEMQRREQAAVKEAEADMEAVTPGAQRRESNNGGGRRRRRGRKR
ncbi:MAG: membrane protein insertase YidC [Chloroflexi bacterium]|nr:MAG: membrane protein insertase YidC [Chloroflexota bacterium]